MSQINTSGINVNYPVPGVNNNSQGFRDNFAAIKNNLNVSATEITDLQNKALLKSALDNTVLDNNMANTLISNASTRGFRATTYNLGNALSGTVVVNSSLGDVQYGTIIANTTFQFSGWAPTGTQSNVQLQLSISNANAVISFPSQVVFANNNFGITTVENFANIANTPTITAPYDVTQLDYRLSTLDCGNSITIEPYNRPRQSSQIQTRTPATTGSAGDTSGAVCVDPSVNQLVISNTAVTTNLITTTGDTSQLYLDMPVVFTGNTFGNISAGTAYYVKTINSSNTFTVTATPGGSAFTVSTSSGNMNANPVTYMYVSTDSYNAVTVGPKIASSTTTTTNVITLNNTTDLVVNAPIVFTGNTFGGITANNVYYIKSINSPNITVSQTRYNGVAASDVVLSTAIGTMSATSYVGSDIWKRVPLNAW
jgi:hypothetical protein